MGAGVREADVLAGGYAETEVFSPPATRYPLIA
jgi:hypothetical protein